MLHDFRIKATTLFLGNKATPEQIRRFIRVKNDQLQVDAPRWQWALKEAATSLGIDTDLNAIRLPLGVRMPTLATYNRPFKRRGVECFEKFECIRIGAVMTIPIFISQEPDPATRRENHPEPPTPEQMRALLRFVGIHIGLSPWGSQFNYGRFQLI